MLEIFAYKEDLFSFHVLCFGFRTSGDGSFWTVGEGYAGFQELHAQTRLRFPGIRTDWLRGRLSGVRHSRDDALGNAFS